MYYAPISGSLQISSLIETEVQYAAAPPPFPIRNCWMQSTENTKNERKGMLNCRTAREMEDYNLLDTPLSVEEAHNNIAHMARLYSIAYMNSTDDELPILLSFHWEEIYQQPVHILLLVCQIVGIVSHSKIEKDIIQAMMKHKFCMRDQLLTSFVDYASNIKK
jgi:hypothetical protein